MIGKGLFLILSLVMDVKRRKELGVSPLYCKQSGGLEWRNPYIIPSSAGNGAEMSE